MSKLAIKVKVHQQILDTGVPRSSGTPPPPTGALCLGPYGGPRGVGDFLRARYPCTGVQGLPEHTVHHAVGAYGRRTGVPRP